MKLPDSYSELLRIFINADDPDCFALSGEYLVDMLGLWPSFKKFSHRKIIWRENDEVKGYNVLAGRRWGYFHVEDAVCPETGGVKAALITYNRPDNSFPVQRIRDFIRSVAPGLYIGRFYYMLPGRMQFLGYFSLEKIIQED